MAFGLTIGTDRANALQTSIQDELIKRGFSPEADAVMAEYITIMIINNKTGDQITAELQELIGDIYEASFTEWLFAEAAKGGEPQPAPQPIPSVATSTAVARDAPPRRPSTGRTGVYQQALNQAVPSSSPSSQKRTASARSPSPAHPNKSRRTGNEVPTGPRAMARDGTNPRSLIERVGRPHRNNNGYNDDVQARIDNIVGNAGPQEMMMNGGGFGQGPMDMGMGMNGMNPMMLQEMFMNQMAMMAHVMGSAGQFPPQPGFPMMPNPDVAMLNQNQSMNGFQNGGDARGRGTSRGGRGGRGRGGRSGPMQQQQSDVPMEQAAPIIVAPAPIPAPAAPPARIPYAVPERPQSPTLCKFGLKCTNVHCRYSHPSPVATAESGVVLSNDPCELGKDCKDKDCVKAHVSPAVLNPQAFEQQPPPQQPIVAPAPVAAAPVATPCRYGASCTRQGCVFQHPAKAPCRFGTSCTKPACPFQHPEGRILPTSFHRGLTTSGPSVNVLSPETGSMGPRGNKSVKFNNTSAGSNVSIKDKLAAQMRELEEKKNLAEQAVKEAEAKKSAVPASASVSA